MLGHMAVRRPPPTDSGFTLVELSVVVLIIAMLITISLPSFLGARRRAQDRATQSNLRQALANAKVVLTDSGDYAGVDAAALASEEPELRFVEDIESTGPDVVSVFSTSTDWVAAAQSRSGTCFALVDRTTGTTGTSFAAWEVTTDPLRRCASSNPLAVFASSSRW